MPEFPDLSSKLAVPVKKSVFEKQRAEAEAKRARDQAETAAVLRDFEASFEDETPRSGSARTGVSGSAGRRHFTSTSLKSGPGTLPRSGPGSLGPAYSKKRPFEDFAGRRGRNGAGEYDNHAVAKHHDAGTVEEEKAAAKPTLRLSSMPPGTSAAVIKGLFARTPLVVENVRILPQRDDTTERRATIAIVTLAAETPSSDIDTAVSHLKNEYLGLGHRLDISRYLSSAAVGNTAALMSSTTKDLPFGAKVTQQHHSLSRAPPPGQNQRFAPPVSYTSSTPYVRGPDAQVIVQQPSDLKQLKLIHKTLEALLTYGPEFEALLMSRAEVQRDEKWSWLWDARSSAGVYYRWRLWSILTNSSGRRRNNTSVTEYLFEGQPTWLPPAHDLRFEYTTNLEDFVSDEDYNSSDEEDGDGGGLARRYNDHSGVNAALDDTNDGTGYLDPLSKAKLTHLLSRLPRNTATLRRGDIARLTAFAIEHAGNGSEEIAQIITRNVVRPFNSRIPRDASKSEPETEKDTTPASMVALYVISDILSCSASAGVRHAWRYRTLFEHALRHQKVFEKLGRAEKELKWGKLKGEKWKRQVQNLLSLWEGWSVFPQASQEEFTRAFLEPSTIREEDLASDVTSKEATSGKFKSARKWKSVGEGTSEDNTKSDDDEDMGDLHGTPMSDDDDNETTSDGNIDGRSMADSSDGEEEAAQHQQTQISGHFNLTSKTSALQSFSAENVVSSNTSDTIMSTAPVTPSTTTSAPSKKPRSRPRAADLFAAAAADDDNNK